MSAQTMSWADVANMESSRDGLNLCFRQGLSVDATNKDDTSTPVASAPASKKR